MPCRSDYMEPTGKEKRLQETCKLLIYAINRCSELGIANGVPAARQKDALIGSRDPYCRKDLVSTLCTLLNSLKRNNAASFDQIVYDGRNPMSRKLADWWEEHEAADKARIAAEVAKQAEEDEVRRILQKLDVDEQEKLADYFANQV